MTKKTPDLINPDQGWAYSIVVRSPEDVFRIYRLPLDMDPVTVEALDAARADAGMPADADPLDSGWDVSISVGKPHPSLLGRSTVVDWREGVPA